MSQHIYAHEHPESETDRGGGLHALVHGLSGSGKTTIAHHVGPEMDRRGLVVEYLDGDTVRTHLSKGLGFSKEDVTHTSSGSAGLPRASRGTAERSSSRRSLRISRHARTHAPWSRSTAPSSRSTCRTSLDECAAVT
jgi:hypothetical protein